MSYVFTSNRDAKKDECLSALFSNLLTSLYVLALTGHQPASGAFKDLATKYATCKLLLI